MRARHARDGAEVRFRGTIFRMKFRTLSEAKAELGTLIRLAEKGESIVISRHGKPAVRLVPVSEDEFTLSVAGAARLNVWADGERRAGRTRTHSSVDALLNRSRTKKSRA